MSDVSYSDPPKQRRWLMQFGTRTLLVLIAIAALGSWWVRGEMVKEQRREEVIALVKREGNNPNWLELDPKAKADWRRRSSSLRSPPATTPS